MLHGRLVGDAAQQLHELGGWLRSLDVDVERASASQSRYIMSAPRPTFLDEVSAPGIVDPGDQTATDRDRRRSGFLPVRGDPILTVPTLSESLAGQVAILDLWPLSVAERSGVRPEIIA